MSADIAKIMDGKAISQEVQAELADETSRFTQETGVTPCLAAVLVGADAASEVYVRNNALVNGSGSVVNFINYPQIQHKKHY